MYIRLLDSVRLMKNATVSSVGVLKRATRVVLKKDPSCPTSWKMFGVEPCHYTGAQSDNPANGFKLLKTTTACPNASVTSELSPDKRKESAGPQP